MSTIFSKIIKGQIPAYKIYATKKTFAFLDISPIEKGHTLVVPKLEVDKFTDLPQEYLQEIFEVSQFLAKAIENSLDCDRVGMYIEGFEVSHFHCHLVPLFKKTGFKTTRKKITEAEMLKVQSSIIRSINEIITHK